MMKQKDNDISFLKHELLLKNKGIDIIESDVWENAFSSFYKEFKVNGIKREDLIYNFLVNFSFGCELFNPSKNFYSITNTNVKWNKGMRVRLLDDMDFIDANNNEQRYIEIDLFIKMLTKLKERALSEGITEIRFNKTISKNIFNHAKEYSNDFLDYFHKLTNNIYYYEFKVFVVDGVKKFINRVWCKANIIRKQELCTVSPLRFGLGEEY